MGLAEQVIDAIVDTAVAGRSRIVACAIKGVSCEGWPKVELLWRLLGIFDADMTEITPELNGVDLVIRGQSEEMLIELKTFPTNYGRTGKPITNFIGGVVDDLAKLARKRTGSAIGLAAWIAYAVPEPIPPTWPIILPRSKLLLQQRCGRSGFHFGRRCSQICTS